MVYKNTQSVIVPKLQRKIMLLVERLQVAVLK